MRTGLSVVAVLLALIGLVWAFQGAGLLGGSFMTGDRLWFRIGIACFIAGIGLLTFVNRRSL